MVKIDYLKRCLELRDVVAKKSQDNTEYVVTIHEPIWATKSVGIAASKVKTVTYIEIDHRDAEGNLVYPDLYKINGEKLRKYPTENRGGVTLFIVPIADLDVVETGT